MWQNVISEIFSTFFNQAHEKHHIDVMDSVSHRGIALILIGRSEIQPICD